MLPQLLKLFPNDVRTFVDVFCGGGNVGMNVMADAVLMNDIDTNVTSLLEMFYNYDEEVFIRDILAVVERYNLSMVSEQSYEYYGANGRDGLADFNREGFMRLRADFNSGVLNYNRCLFLYVLIIYAFNNQIRFNSNGGFNLPVGKRDFNSRMRQKVISFIERIHKINPQITHTDFRQINIGMFKEKDFFYFDPPYLITCATYNEKRGWTRETEMDLYKFLDNLHNNHLRFALSNVLRSKGRTNDILSEWLQDNEDIYTCHHLNMNYSNSSYHTNDRISGSDEVLITNYAI